MSFPFKHADAHQISSVLPVLVLMLLLAFGRPVIAQDCEIQQITFGLDDLSLPGPPPSVSADSRRVAFASEFDLLGGNSDNNAEVYLWDAESGISQITASTGVFNRTPTISGNGRWVAFPSNGDYTGENPDGNQEIFLLAVDSGVVTQITDTTTWFHESLGLDDTGDTAVMLSNADPTGANVDHSREIFVLDLTTMDTTQITEATGDSVRDPAISGDGSAVAFRSSDDLVPGSNPDRNSEIFLYNTGEPLLQVTDTTTGFNDEADLDWDGRRLAFTSDNDLVPGNNLDLNGEVFLWDLGVGFTQVTDTSGGAPTYAPTINDAGRLVAFVSGHEIVPGQNPSELDHLFVWEETTGEFTQVTFGNDQPNAFPDLSGSGVSVVFYSMGELVSGGNPTGDFQIFARVCGLFRDGFVTGDLRRWSAVATVAHRSH